MLDFRDSPESDFDIAGYSSQPAFQPDRFEHSHPCKFEIGSQVVQFVARRRKSEL
jgi:hypothetical protein